MQQRASPKPRSWIEVLVVHRSASCLACVMLPDVCQLMDQTHISMRDGTAESPEWARSRRSRFSWPRDENEVAEYRAVEIAPHAPAGAATREDAAAQIAG